MFLLVGLGNPGKQYEQTRHNIGFMAVDQIGHRHFSSVQWQKKFSGQWATVHVRGQKVGLLKPETYMNLSGKSVQAAMQFFKVPLNKVIVIHDELDLPLGRIKYKLGGGAAGHNGLKDIDQKVGKNYHRVRLGVGHPGVGRDVSNYVLGKFTSQESQNVEQVVGEVADYIDALFTPGEESKFSEQIALSRK